MTLDFECDSKDMDETTSDLLETSRVLLEERLSHNEVWSDDLDKQCVQFGQFKVIVTNAIQLITGVSGSDATLLFDKLINDSPEEYVPWQLYKNSYLYRNKELLDALRKQLNEEFKK